MIAFGQFSLDEESHRLRYAGVERRLRAKSLAVLRELLRRRGRLVTKEELFRACWPNTAVSQTVLRVCIAEIRAALAVDVTGANAVHSIGRRGYRLMSDPGEHEPAGPPIGRDRELATLRRALARANASRRQVVFVTGEPGLGKTTLVQHFVEETRAATRTRIGWGQCVELTGGPEAHFPILDALGRLCAQDPSGTVVETLERVAPSWLLQIPALVDAARADSIARRAANGSGDRMLRELAEALEAVAADETLVLVIEDLHWSDFASVDALACLAQRSGPARLLIVGTYRPAGVAREGPLDRIKQGLIARRQATEIPLAPLAPPAEISER